MKKALEQFLLKFENGKPGEILVEKDGKPAWVKQEGKVDRQEVENGKGLPQAKSGRSK